MTGGKSLGDALSSRRSLSQALRGDRVLRARRVGAGAGIPLLSSEGPSATEDGGDC